MRTNEVRYDGTGDFALAVYFFSKSSAVRGCVRNIRALDEIRQLEAENILAGMSRRYLVITLKLFWNLEIAMLNDL